MATLRVRFQTLEFGDTDIHVRTLRDRQQFADDEGAAEALGICSASWPLFGVIWPAGQVLAHLMHDFDVAGKRILEVGCGIGLASLVLNARAADITATDHHPEAGAFLQHNTRLNDDADIPFVRTGWADPETALGLFDVIIGSDVLYEREQVALLSDFIEQHARPTCEVILIDPGRGHHAPFSKVMQRLGYTLDQRRVVDTDHSLAQGFSGQVLRYRRTQ